MKPVFKVNYINESLMCNTLCEFIEKFPAWLKVSSGYLKFLAFEEVFFEKSGFVNEIRFNVRFIVQGEYNIETVTFECFLMKD